ncbi:MAG: helix-turn-helix domain-containing protein [Brevinematia bacterium]
MKHFLFFYYLVTSFSGLLGYFGIIFMWLKYRNRVMRYYFIFYTAFSIHMFINVYQYYRYIVSPAESFVTTYPVSVLFVLAHSLFFFSVPVFIYEAIEKRLPSLLYIFSKVFGFTGIIVVLFSLFFDREKRLSIIVNFDNLFYVNAFFIFLIFNIFLIRKYITEIRIIIIKNIFKFAFWLTLIFIPFFAVDSMWEFFQVRWKILPRCFNFTPVYYFIWNVISSYYILRFMTEGNAVLFLKEVVSEKFLRKYKIGKRETEILGLIIQGLDNKEISEKLFISESTVRNHISNIYQKTGVSNRVGLIKFIGEEIISLEKWRKDGKISKINNSSGF